MIVSTVVSSVHIFVGLNPFPCLVDPWDIEQTYRLLRFHPYELRLYAGSSETGEIMVFDTATVGATSVFHSGMSKDARLTSMMVINEQRDSLLMLGSSDGMVRVWRDLDSPMPSLATAWRAIPKMRDSQEGQGSGLVLAWHQSRGQLLATGDVQQVHVWDANTEVRGRRIPTGINSCVTAMDFDDSGFNVVGGLGLLCIISS